MAARRKMQAERYTRGRFQRLVVPLMRWYILRRAKTS
jgi:hypothetical protein